LHAAVVVAIFASASSASSPAPRLPVPRLIPLVRIAAVLILCGVAGCGSAPGSRGAAAHPDSTAPLAAPAAADTMSGIPPCRETSCRTPDSVAGDYVLIEMDGKPLPHTRHFAADDEPGRRCTSIVEDETIRLGADGRFEQSGSGRIWCDDMRPPAASSRSTLTGGYALYGPGGDSIAMGITAIDPPARLQGVLDADELRVADISDWSSASRTFRYARRRP
jgi:hypothetical protein